MSGHRLVRIADRMFNRPQLIEPTRAMTVIRAMQGRLGVGAVEAFSETAAPEQSAASEASVASDVGMEGSENARKPFLYRDGVAVIEVEGLLVNKLGTLRPWCGMTGYDGIASGLGAALDDDDVQAVILDIESGGGEVAGCFDLCDAIRGARAADGGDKPIWAVLTEEAYSAAYAIASSCDRILVPRTGGVGSIGVVIAHADVSGALAEEGIKVTLIHAGAHKVDGNPYQPLPDTVREALQAEVEDVADLFAATVAAGRGIDAAAVRATEAAVYAGPARLAEAIGLGLADTIASPGEAWALLQAEIAGA